MILNSVLKTGTFLICILLGNIFLLGISFGQEVQTPVSDEKSISAQPADGSVPPIEIIPIEKASFNRAEYLYRAGRFGEAKIVFEKFIEENPRDKNIDRAVFRLGQIDFNDKFYVTSLKYFDYLLENFPGTPVLHEALLLMGACNFYLGKIEDAERIFQSEIKLNPDDKQKIKALFFLGKIHEKKFDYGRAIERLSQVYKKGPDSELKEQTLQTTQKIIDEKLSKEKLFSLVQKYRKSFPADLALWKLITIFRLEKDIESYIGALTQFVETFPNHSFQPEAMKMLALSKKNNAVKTVRIGAILPLTGKRAITGQQVLQGIQLAFNNLTSEEKARIELVVKDSGSRSIDEGLEELAADPNVLGVLGPVLSGNVKKAVPLLEKYSLPALTPTASSSGLTDLSPYIFRNAMTRPIQSRFLAEYAVNTLGLRRFVVFYPDANFGQELKDAFLEEVEALGAEVVAAVSYNRSQNDFKPQILEIGGISDSQLKKITLKKLAESENKAKNKGSVPFSKPIIEQGLFNEDKIEGLKVSLELSYDAIFIPGFYDKVSLIIPQMVFYNIDQVTFLGTNGWNHADLIKVAGRYIKGKGIFSDGFFKESKKQEVQQFVSRFKTTFGDEPNILSAQAYDSAQIFLNIAQANVKNRLEFFKRLKNVEEFLGASGTTTLTENGDAEKKLFALKIKGKKIVEKE
jgi:branched-chain amino acid transport system substrate-binding protein